MLYCLFLCVSTLWFCFSRFVFVDVIYLCIECEFFFIVMFNSADMYEKYGNDMLSSHYKEQANTFIGVIRNDSQWLDKLGLHSGFLLLCAQNTTCNSLNKK